GERAAPGGPAAGPRPTRAPAAREADQQAETERDGKAGQEIFDVHGRPNAVGQTLDHFPAKTSWRMLRPAVSKDGSKFDSNGSCVRPPGRGRSTGCAPWRRPKLPARQSTRRSGACG